MVVDPGEFQILEWQIPKPVQNGLDIQLAASQVFKQFAQSFRVQGGPLWQARASTQAFPLSVC